MSEWQPIETAPKDGTWVHLTGGAHCYHDWDCPGPPPAVVSAQWSTRELSREVPGRWMAAWYDGGIYGAYYRPTHWRPLLEPPEPVK